MPNDALSLVERSSSARRAGDHATAVSLAEEAKDAAQSSGDPKALGAAYSALGRLRRDEHSLEAAAELYGLAIALARESDDANALAQRLRHVGDIAVEQGNFARAEQCYDEAGPLFDALEVGPLTSANFLRSVALLREKQGANAAAAGLWSDARSLYAEAGIDAGVEESDRRLRRLSSS